MELCFITSIMNWIDSYGTLAHMFFSSMTNGTALGGLMAYLDPDAPPTDITQVPPASTAIDQQGNLGFFHGFVASLSMILVSEIGDKTFFIAAIMSMKHSRITVFVGAISALTLMTILSVFFGWIATVIPKAITHYISIILFAIFGVKMLRDGYYMSPNDGGEFEEVQTDLRKRDEEFEEAEKSKEREKLSDNPTPNSDNKFEKEVLSSDVESGASQKKTASVLFVVSRIILQAFSLTFVAEWGDRSQVSTIVLAAREDVIGVTLGGIVGHSICTGAAVIGGRFIAQKISVRTVTMIGGVVFLIFAVSAFLMAPPWNS